MTIWKRILFLRIYLVSIENIRDVQCNIDQIRTGTFNSQERSTKLSRQVRIQNISEREYFIFDLFAFVE